MNERLMGYYMGARDEQKATFLTKTDGYSLPLTVPLTDDEEEPIFSVTDCE